MTECTGTQCSKRRGRRGSDGAWQRRGGGRSPLGKQRLWAIPGDGDLLPIPGEGDLGGGRKFSGGGIEFGKDKGGM